VGEQQQLVQTNLDRLADRLPPWARGVRAWPVRRVVAAAAIVVLVAVLAVSCLGGSDGRADVPVMSDGAGVGVSGVRAPSDATGGTLRVVAAEVDSLDPQRSYQPGVWNLMRLYTRTLVTYSTEPGRTGDLVPDLATDLGQTDDGGKTWTFTLREGVRFETGAPITSKDVRYGIARSFDANVITGGPTTHIIDALDDPDNPYPGPYDREEGDPNLSAVRTPDDRTIVFTLRRAMPEFPYILALPSSSPVPQDADTKGAYGKDPVSSGPYAVTSVDEHAGIVLERNAEWDQATDPVRTALPDRIVVRTGLNGVQRDQALLAGSADVDITGVGVQRPTTVRIDADDEDGELAGRVDDVTTGQLRMLAMPTNVAPMDDADCRTAVSEAIDRRGVQQALGGAGDAVRTSQLWPRAVPGGPDEPDPRPDLAAAKAALEACGQPDGFTTSMAVADVASNVLVAREIAAQLAEVGIQVDVQPTDPDVFYGEEIGSPSNVKKKRYGLILTSWTADFPTPASFLVPLVDSRSTKSSPNTNYAWLRWEQVDVAVNTARKSTDQAAAREIWRKVAELARGTNAYVPLVETRVQLVAGQRLRNGVVMQPYGSYDLATAGVR
jgi:peptide/nickel transport system substrate-binding protein